MKKGGIGPFLAFAAAILILTFIAVISSAQAQALKVHGDYCEAVGECEPHLICGDDAKCGCALGHVNNSCLHPVRTKDEKCHVDEQCFDLFGHSVSLCPDKGSGSESKCACIEKYIIVDSSQSPTFDKFCQLTCENHEDCTSSDPSPMHCAPIQDGDGGNGVNVCQFGASPDRETDAKAAASTSRPGPKPITPAGVAIIVLSIMLVTSLLKPLRSAL